MRRADEVSPERLRGGSYTPAPLVMFTLERLREARGASLTGATGLSEQPRINAEPPRSTTAKIRRGISNITPNDP